MNSANRTSDSLDRDMELGLFIIGGDTNESSSSTVASRQGLDPWMP